MMAVPAAPPPAAAPTAGQRWRRLIGARAAASRVMPLQASAAEGPPMLLVAEAFVRLPREQQPGLDWIAVAGLGGAHSRLRVVGPGAMRARSVPISDGLLLQGIELAAILPGDEPEAWFALCAVPRRAALSRVLAAVEDLGAACDPGTDPAGNEALHLAIVERLELLAASPGVQWRLAGRVALPHPPGAAAHHLLVTNEAPGTGVPLLVKDGRLLAGSRAETAQPWREQEYTLLRIGPRPERAVYDIDLLRRQHALIHSGAAAPAGDGESYQAKSARLRSSNRLLARFGRAGMERFPVVTPIAIEAHANLAALLQGSEGRLLHPGFAARINAMRDRLRERMGVAVPGLRLRINDGDLPPSSYIIMLDEIPLVMNTADPEVALVMLPAAALDVDGIDAEDTTHPAGGAQACRVRREHWAAAREKGFELQEADAVIASHLHYLLMRNLEAYVRLGDVEALLTPLPGLRARLMEMPGGLPRLCGMLRSLLSERVPIRALQEIVERSLECWAMPIHEIVEELRCLPGVRETLPGNDAGTALLLLADEIVAELDAGAVSDGDALVLSLGPEATQQLLAAVRDTVADLPTPNAALLVDNPRLRMPVRKLVELEFPELMVLSRREAVAAGDRPVAATITLD